MWTVCCGAGLEHKLDVIIIVKGSYVWESILSSCVGGRLLGGCRQKSGNNGRFV